MLNLYQTKIRQFKWFVHIMRSSRSEIVIKLYTALYVQYFYWI